MTNEGRPESEQLLSSRMTNFGKAIWIFASVDGVIGCCAAWLGYGRLGTQSLAAKLGLTGFACFTIAFLALRVLPATRVALAGRTLIVSDSSHTERIDVGEIRSVSDRLWPPQTLVRVRFTRYTAFGDAIIFLPEHRWFGSVTRAAIATLRTAGEGTNAEQPGRPLPE